MENKQTHAVTKEKIIWPYVCYFPLYICENKELVKGYAYHILKLIWKQMPEYEHEIMLSPIKRIFEDAKSGKKQLFYGTYKTPEREKFLHFSLPCRISPPTYIVIRKNEFKKFGKESQVSLKYLLENTDFRFLIFNSISFGAGIDELLAQHRNNPNVIVEYNTTNMGLKSLKLLLNKRVDYLLSLDGMPYDAHSHGVSHQLTYLKIKEQSKYEVGYITAPKTDWGEQMIKLVNDVLRKEIPLESFFQIFKPLVGKEMIPELKRQFNQKILEPSQN
ncbi:hypothetical protein QUF70_13045 [Desulfobacterales bacterium HSG17]|nr:hypothetical protein [Desulfobacterales bacterium HSG17]